MKEWLTKRMNKQTNQRNKQITTETKINKDIFCSYFHLFFVHQNNWKKQLAKKKQQQMNEWATKQMNKLNEPTKN